MTSDFIINNVRMKNEQLQPEDDFKSHLDNLCLFIDKKIDESTKQLCPNRTGQQPHSSLTWLKQVFVALISSKCNLQELMTSRQDTQCSQYEESLQKLESEIRHHIGIEEQMKIHFENLQERIIGLEAENTKLGAQLERSKRKEKIVVKKREEEVIGGLKTERGRSLVEKGKTSTMVRSKSRCKLKAGWELMENVDFNNVHVAAKLSKRGNNNIKAKGVR